MDKPPHNDELSDISRNLQTSVAPPRPKLSDGGHETRRLKLGRDAAVRWQRMERSPVPLQPVFQFFRTKLTDSGERTPFGAWITSPIGAAAHGRRHFQIHEVVAASPFAAFDEMGLL
jgi:hypothetical protein